MLIIERLNGERYELTIESTGLKLIDFTVSSPNPQTVIDEIPGMDGHLDLGTNYLGRNLYAEFKVFAADNYDFPLVRNQIFKIFDSKEHFYLIYEREPSKRWLVKCSSGYSIQQLMAKFGEFTIPFISASSYSQSIGTTLDPFTFDSDLWQIGQGLTAEDLQYKHTSTMFNIFNVGDVTIDPRNMELVIEYKGSSSNLKIKNETTGEEWQFNGTSNVGDTIKLDGVRATRNGLSIFRETNRKLITLVPGWNGFRLTGTIGSFEISFKFRFHYL